MRLSIPNSKMNVLCSLRTAAVTPNACFGTHVAFRSSQERAALGGFWRFLTTFSRPSGGSWQLHVAVSRRLLASSRRLLATPAGFGGLSRDSPEPPGAAKRPPGIRYELPGAARSSQEQPGLARSSQERPGAAKSSQEQLGAARSRQEPPEGYKEPPGTASVSLCLLAAAA